MAREVHGSGTGGDVRPSDTTQRQGPIRRPLVGSDAWAALTRDGEVVSVAAGTLLYEPSPAPPVLAILSGSARQFIRTPVGRQVTLRYARAGELVGLGARLGGVDTTAAEAVTDTTAAVLSLERVERLALENPALGWVMAQHMAVWAADLARALTDHEVLPMTSRVAGHLLEVCRSTTDGDVAHITHQRLADAVGTAREVVSRSLAALQRAGVVQTSLGEVIVIDHDRLTQIASGAELPVPQVTGAVNSRQ